MKQRARTAQAPMPIEVDARSASREHGMWSRDGSDVLGDSAAVGT
jgi:hypothetical protein